MQCSNWGRELLYNYLYFKRTLTYYFDKNVGTVSYFLLDIFFISQNYIANEMFKFKMMNYTFIHLIIIIIIPFRMIVKIRDWSSPVNIKTNKQVHRLIITVLWIRVVFRNDFSQSTTIAAIFITFMSVKIQIFKTKLRT